MKGPGLFLCAEVVKQGGTPDGSFVILDIDDRNVIDISYGAARVNGLTQQNPYGVVLLQSAGVRNLTIGFPSPLRFRKNLRLSVNVDEDGVQQVHANVIHGS